MHVTDEEAQKVLELYRLVNTMEKLVDKDKLELELQEKGSCVCDNYVSYSSTILPGMPVAALMQFEDCVNCHDICSAIMSAAIRSKTRTVEMSDIMKHFDSRVESVNNGWVSSSILENGEYRKRTNEELIASIEEERVLGIKAFESGRAQAMVDKWYASYDARKLELANKS